jgi:hypothetical protein
MKRSAENLKNLITPTTIDTLKDIHKSSMRLALVKLSSEDEKKYSSPMKTIIDTVSDSWKITREDYHSGGALPTSDAHAMS